MTGKTDIIKGRIKEAAGVLTGSEKLRAEGQTDQAVGKVKETARQAVDQAKDVAQAAVKTAKHAAQETIDKAKNVAKRMND